MHVFMIIVDNSVPSTKHSPNVSNTRPCSLRTPSAWQQPCRFFVETYGAEQDSITNAIEIAFACRPGAIAVSLPLREPSPRPFRIQANDFGACYSRVEIHMFDRMGGLRVRQLTNVVPQRFQPKFRRER